MSLFRLSVMVVRASWSPVLHFSVASISCPTHFLAYLCSSISSSMIFWCSGFSGFSASSLNRMSSSFPWWNLSA